MCGRNAVTNQLSLIPNQYATGLYASKFLHTSITIMATVCCFSPSQLVGVFVVGLGDRKNDSPLPSTAEQHSGLLLAICGDCGLVPHSPRTDLLFSKRAGALARSGNLRYTPSCCTTYRGFRDSDLRNRDFYIGPNRGIRICQ